MTGPVLSRVEGPVLITGRAGRVGVRLTERFVEEGRSVRAFDLPMMDFSALEVDFDKFTPFPYDRHDGKGFARNDEVDLEAMKRHYEHSINGYHAEIDEEALAPADDD